MTAQQLAPWCKRGHEMTPDNIRLGRCGERLCKTCLRLHLRAVRAPKMDTTGVGPRRGVPPTIRDTPLPGVGPNPLASGYRGRGAETMEACARKLCLSRPS